MRTLHRLKLMSSPSLSELGKSEKNSPEDRGEKQKRAGANATWNRYAASATRLLKMQHAALGADAGLFISWCSIHNAVIAVFQKKGLADNELYVLNEGVRYVSTTNHAHTIHMLKVEVIFCVKMNMFYCPSYLCWPNISLWMTCFVYIVYRAVAWGVTWLWQISHYLSKPDPHFYHITSTAQ